MIDLINRHFRPLMLLLVAIGIVIAGVFVANAQTQPPPNRQPAAM